jgi:CheY-like chemotaxis protein
LQKVAPHYNETPIIALTAATSVGEEQKALSVGCNAFLPKPCEPMQIKKKIEEVLSKGRSI